MEQDKTARASIKMPGHPHFVGIIDGFVDGWSAMMTVNTGNGKSDRLEQDIYLKKA